MKILIVRPFPSIVNLKNNAYNQQEIGLGTSFLKLGHEVGIVYYGNDNDEFAFSTEFGKIDIFYRKAKRVFKVFSIFDDFNCIKNKYDLIITDEYNQIESFKICRDYKNKCIIYHGPYFSKFKKIFNIFIKIYDVIYLKKLIKLNPLILTKSKLAKEYLERKRLLVSDYVGVGLDIKQLETKAKNSIYCNDIKYSNYNLLYIGVLEERRNIIFLLKVLNKLVKIDNRYKITIVGKYKNSSYKKKVEKFINKNNLKDYVRFVESIPQNELPSIYKVHNVFLLPSSYEIWGMVLMEALLYGNGIITTFNGGSSSMIQNNNGIILELDVNKWVDSIVNFKERVRSDYKTFNKDLIMNNFNWDNIAQKMINLFSQFYN